MIGHVGYFGAGKTMALTGFLLEKLKSKKNIVVTNYRVEGAHLYIPSFDEFMEFLEWLYDAQVRRIPELRGKNLYIAIDEASVWFDSRNFKRFPENLVAFIRQLRKLRTELHFTAQSATSVDKNFRLLTEYWIYHTRPMYWLDRDKSVKNEKGEEIDNIRIPRWFNSWGFSKKWELSPDSPVPDPMQGATYLGFGGFYRMTKKIHEAYDSTEIVLKNKGGIASRSEERERQWLEMLTRDNIFKKKSSFPILCQNSKTPKNGFLMRSLAK